MEIPKKLIERAQKREKRSQEHEQRFRAGDEMALREFCRLDPFAIKTPWVQEAIQTAFLCGNTEILKTIFSGGRGEGRSRITIMTENLIILHTANRMAAQTGLPKSAPLPPDTDEIEPPETVFDKIYQDQALTFGRVQELEPRTLFNRYHKARNQVPDVMIVHTPSGWIIRTGPALSEVEQTPMVGIHEQHVPHDGSDTTIKFTGVFNVPYGQTVSDALPPAFR